MSGGDTLPRAQGEPGLLDDSAEVPDLRVADVVQATQNPYDKVEVLVIEGATGALRVEEGGRVPHDRCDQVVPLETGFHGHLGVDGGDALFESTVGRKRLDEEFYVALDRGRGRGDEPELRDWGKVRGLVGGKVLGAHGGDLSAGV
jgi:hypothetical protein